MRLIICGSRSWDDYAMILFELRRFHDTVGITRVIHGGAQGADTLAGRAAEELGIPVTIFPAKWSLYGRSAGYKRNWQMAKCSSPDSVWAFQVGRSAGTQHMIDIAHQHRISVLRWSCMGEKEAVLAP